MELEQNRHQPHRLSPRGHGLTLTDQREAATLQALREAARAGSDSIERGDYKELGSFDELDDVIVAITAPIISGSSAQ